MSKTLFFEEMDKLLDGIINAPRTIIRHLLLHEDATLERLESLFRSGYRKIQIQIRVSNNPFCLTWIFGNATPKKEFNLFSFFPPRWT